MVNGTQLRRLMWLALLLSLAFAGLGYRLLDLQWLRHEELNLLAQKNSQRRILHEPRRGDVLDIKGNPLATSVLVKRVCANPSFLGTNQAAVARVPAPLLQESEARLVERLQPRLQQTQTGKVVTNVYVVLKQKVPVRTWELICTNMLALSFGVDESKLKPREKDFYRVLRHKAIFAEDDQERVYPNQNLAAHVVGYVGSLDGELDGRPITETVGMDGIERTFNAKLEGVRGWRVTHFGLTRELVRNREQDVEARDGLNVVLTIDSVVQHILEAALQEAMEKHTPVSVSGIVIRPRTGEILAMVRCRGRASLLPDDHPLRDARLLRLHGGPPRPPRPPEGEAREARPRRDDARPRRGAVGGASRYLGSRLRDAEVVCDPLENGFLLRGDLATEPEEAPRRLCDLEAPCNDRLRRRRLRLRAPIEHPQEQPERMLEEAGARAGGDPPLETGPRGALRFEAPLERHLEDLGPLLVTDLAVAPGNQKERRDEEERHRLRREAVLLEVIEVRGVGHPHRSGEAGPPCLAFLLLSGLLQELALPRPNPGFLLLSRFFFGALIPLALKTGSRVLIPSLYGIGTGLPVVFFAVLLALATHHVARAFEKLAAVERMARRITGQEGEEAGVVVVENFTEELKQRVPR